MTAPACDRCRKEFVGPGGILLGPPDAQDRLKRSTLCSGCYSDIGLFIEIGRDLNSHAGEVGKLIGNLQSLEFLARAAISEMDPASRSSQDLLALKPGQTVKPDAFTGDASLGETLREYNRLVPAQYHVRPEPIVALREALAHGRISAAKPAMPLRLLKFGKLKDGQILVELSVDLTEGWFEDQMTLLRGAILSIKAALPAREG